MFSSVGVPLKNLAFFLFDLSNMMSSGAVEIVNALCSFLARSKTPTFMYFLQAPQYFSTKASSAVLQGIVKFESFESINNTMTDLSACSKTSEIKLFPTIFLILRPSLSSTSQLLYCGSIFFILTSQMKLTRVSAVTYLGSQMYLRSWKLEQSVLVIRISYSFYGSVRIQSAKYSERNYLVAAAKRTRSYFRPQLRFLVAAISYYFRIFLISSLSLSFCRQTSNICSQMLLPNTRKQLSLSRRVTLSMVSTLTKSTRSLISSLRGSSLYPSKAQTAELAQRVNSQPFLNSSILFSVSQWALTAKEVLKKLRKSKILWQTAWVLFSVVSFVVLMKTRNPSLWGDVVRSLRLRDRTLEAV